MIDSMLIYPLQRVFYPQNRPCNPKNLSLSGCPLSFETVGTMGYNCCFFLNFVPLHIESPYNFGGTGPILGVKNPLQRVNGHAVKPYESIQKHSVLILIFGVQF
jgi:hypothetical protein